MGPPARTERPGIHRQRHPVAVADREHEESHEQTRVPPAPAAPAAPDPTRLAEGRQVLTEAWGRLMPSRTPPWTAVVQGVFGLRALGVSLGFSGGAEFPVPGGALGTGEVRLGFELVELITFIKLQSESSQPVF